MTAPVKRRYDATRRQEQARENQRRIIDAATTLFADRGWTPDHYQAWLTRAWTRLLLTPRPG